MPSYNDDGVVDITMVNTSEYHKADAAYLHHLASCLHVKLSPVDHVGQCERGAFERQFSADQSALSWNFVRCHWFDIMVSRADCVPSYKAWQRKIQGPSARKIAHANGQRPSDSLCIDW